ncbi:G2/mitotic-specific cyclin, partial [Ceratobasidium sp. 392]
TRRTTRLTRTHLDENATAASRTRGAAKPVATATIAVKTTTSAPATRRPVLATNKDKEAASDVRTADAAKRKRDALGELTNKAKAKVTLKGKDGKPLAAKTNESTLRRTHSAANSVSESIKAEEIMDVDGSKGSEGATTKSGSEEADPRPRFSRRLSARTVSASSAPPQLSTVTAQAPRRAVSVATRSLKAASHARTLSAQVSTSSLLVSSTAPTTSRTQTPHQPSPEEDSDGPAHKRRRTSSLEAQEASRAVAQVEQSVEPAPVDPDEIWTDLDKDDDGDPLMVSEYVIDIFNYMLELEKTQAQSLNPHYIEKQKELNWGMRGILGDWLIQVHARFRLLPETLYLAMHLVDRMLSIRVVSLSRLQLVGVTCMFIAAKYEEIMAPSVKHFVECADSAYTEKDILDAEQYVLRVLGWDCSYPNVMTFLRRVSKAEDFDDQTRSVGKFFVEIACVDHRLLPFPPSQIAAASLWLARLILDRDTW